MTNAAVLDEPLTGAPTRELVEAVSLALDEPRWLLEHRLRALTAYDALDWPSGEEEEWRRTPLAEVLLEGYRLLMDANGAAPPPALLAAAAEERAGLIVHVDGAVRDQEIADATADQGVLLLPLSQAAREHEALVRPHLNSVVAWDEDRFTALSGALWTQGVFCYVPPDTDVTPALFHLVGKTGAGQGLFGHTLIVAEDGSSLTLVEAAMSDDAPTPSLSHRTVEIIAESAAHVRLVELQRWGTDVNAFVTTRARLGRDARVLIASTVFGATFNRERIEVDLDGDGSKADLVGLFVGGDSQHVEYNTHQNHRGVGGASDLLIKGALTERANAVQYGVIKIFPEGQKTSGFQTMRNLLLSEGASANPIPVLEIEADDVKCSHAAAVGPVDAEHIFYLQARGIPKDTAERMVVQGFLQVAVERLPDAHVRNVVEELINAKLHNGVGA